MQPYNQEPQAHFHGLSPDQMEHFLYSPFDSPELVSIPEKLAVMPTVPILTLFELLAEAIGEKGVKPTAKGNLPRNLCREVALNYLGEDGYQEKTRYGNINKEEDFLDLHVTRLIAELAGLMRKYKGKFVLTRTCRGLLSDQGRAGLYPTLFRTYVEKFNWGYWDGYADYSFIQQSFLFTLYLLKRYGDSWRPDHFYADCYLNAFPVLLDQVEPLPYRTQEDELGSCYTLRTLVHFVDFLGLAKVEGIDAKGPIIRNYRVIGLPLLDEVVQFHFRIPNR